MNNPKDNPLVVLQVDFLTQGTQLRHAHILFLRERHGERRLPLLVDEKESQVLRDALLRKGFPTTDVATEVMRACDVKLHSVVVSTRENLSYQGMLVLEHPELGLHYAETSATNALCMALQNRTDILMPRKVFDLRHSPQGLSGQMSFSISSMSDELLEEALSMAVENDEFEVAAHLQREIEARKEEN